VTENIGGRLIAEHEHILGRVTAVVPHQVIFYIDHDGETSLVHTRYCHNQQEARDFALTVLVNAYMLVDEPWRLWRTYWCELIPIQRVNGQWIPDPAARDHVDAAYLDSETGQISFDLDASMAAGGRIRRRAVADNDTGAAREKANGYHCGCLVSLPPRHADPQPLPHGMSEWDADTLLSGERLDPKRGRGDRIRESATSGRGADARGEP
jgi:hypothetical protein